jgi:hypothetical protein
MVSAIIVSLVMLAAGFWSRRIRSFVHAAVRDLRTAMRGHGQSRHAY